MKLIKVFRTLYCSLCYSSAHCIVSLIDDKLHNVAN